MTARSTHVLVMTDGLVTKQYRSWDRGEHHREWQALSVLAEFAPGLAPAPVSADLDAIPPAVTMTRLPGTPLAERPVSARHLDALAATLTRLHTCVPRDVLARIRPHAWLTEGPATRLRSRTDQMRRHYEGEPIVHSAFTAAARWLDHAGDPAEPLTAVLGQGDGSLANFLWDGSGLRVVDFEDAGRSDRTFEIAGLVEHIGTWREAGIDADDILARFDLTAAESERLRFFRRVFAIFWLHLVHKRPGPVAGQQAERVVSLLDA
jgi:Ser/Thr protein kinase RdoA (MazF antagonist)